MYLVKYISKGAIKYLHAAVILFELVFTKSLPLCSPFNTLILYSSIF